MKPREVHGFHSNKSGDNEKTTWMLFRQAGSFDDPTSFFNECLYELSGAELFDTQQSMNQAMAKGPLYGKPYMLEVGIEKNQLNELLKTGKYREIATSIKSMNGKEVTYDGERFSYPAPGSSKGV